MTRNANGEGSIWLRKDGRWYLSAFYSIAETLRHEADAPDIPAEGVALNGGDSPEAAMDNLINAAAGLDPQRGRDLRDLERLAEVAPGRPHHREGNRGEREEAGRLPVQQHADDAHVLKTDW